MTELDLEETVTSPTAPTAPPPLPLPTHKQSSKTSDLLTVEKKEYEIYKTVKERTRKTVPTLKNWASRLQARGPTPYLNIWFLFGHTYIGMNGRLLWNSIQNSCLVEVRVRRCQPVTPLLVSWLITSYQNFYQKTRCVSTLMLCQPEVNIEPVSRQISAVLKYAH